jgi:ABC-type uncharacterized transport system substrate-binding protein
MKESCPNIRMLFLFLEIKWIEKRLIICFLINFFKPQEKDIREAEVALFDIFFLTHFFYNRDLEIEKEKKLRSITERLEKSVIAMRDDQNKKAKEVIELKNKGYYF